MYLKKNYINNMFKKNYLIQLNKLCFIYTNS